jgi:hypothetical protein
VFLCTVFKERSTSQTVVGDGSSSSLVAITGLTPVSGSTLPAFSGTAPALTSAGDCFTLASGNTIRGVNIGNTGGYALISAVNIGTASVTETSITGNGGLFSLTGGGTFNAGFNTLTSTGHTAAIIDLVNTGGTITNSAGSISHATAAAITVNISGGAPTLTYTGGITKTAGGRVISVATTTGGTVTFNGIVTQSVAAGTGIIVNNAAGNVAFTTLNLGATTPLTSTAVTLTGNTGTISSTAGTISTTNATAININGPAGLTPLAMMLTSVSANGGANGIFIQNTSGSFTIAGTGTAGSGGTIQNTTGADGSTNGIGIRLSTTTNIALNHMQINDHPNFAIFGQSVVGFTMNNSIVSGANGTNAGLDEGSIRFLGLTGSATISNSTLSGALENNFTLINTVGTLNRITFTNVTFGAMSTADGNDNLYVRSENTAVVNVTVQNSAFTSARGDIMQLQSRNNGTLDLIFTGNTISNNHPGIATGGGGITIDNDAGTMTLNMSGNSFRDSIGHAVLIINGGALGSLIGTFANNTIGVPGVANSGSLEGDGLKLHHWGGGGPFTMAVTNNQVYQYNNQGIHVQAGAGLVESGNFNVTITGNTIANPGNNPAIGLIFQGLHLNSGVTPGDSFQVCMNIQNNTMTNSGRNGGDDFRLRQRQSTTVRLPGYGGANDNTVAVVAFVQGNNVVPASGSAAVDILSGGGFVGGAACALP